MEIEETGSSLDINALLKEQAWLARLAQRLVKEVGAAEALAQDVMVVALGKRLALEGRSLRAWLATTARRMAGRKASREGYRAQVESMAAVREGVDDLTSERLRTGEELLEALQKLSAGSRTAVVMRYLEERSYDEMASLLGLPQGTLRQQVSRGLKELAAILDAKHGERRAWLPSMMALGSGTFTGGAVPSASAPTAAELSETGATALGSSAMGSPFIFLFAMKKIVLGLTAAALLITGTFLVIEPGDSDSPLPTEPPVSIPDEAVVAIGAQGSELGKAGDRVGQEGERESITAYAGASELPNSRLRVVDNRGRPVTAAKVAWIGADGNPVALLLDDEGAAELSGLGSYIAGAPGFSMASAALDHEAEEDLILVLQPTVNLRGYILVDGDSPDTRIEVARRSSGEHLGLSKDWQALSAQRRALVALGVAPKPDTSTVADFDGRFVFEGVDRNDRGVLRVPEQYRNLGSSSVGASLGYERPSEELKFPVTVIDFLHGRLVWADSKSALQGEILVRLEESGTGLGGTYNCRIWADGRFVVGLPREPSNDKKGRLLHTQVRIQAWPSEGRCTDGVFEFKLEGAKFPMDVGTLELERAPELFLRVLDGQGNPVAGALASCGGTTFPPSGANGHVQLVVHNEQEFSVISLGFDPLRLAVPESLGSREEPVEVNLNPGAALSIRVAGVDGGTSVRSIPRILVEFSRDDLLHGQSEHREIYDSIQMLNSKFNRSRNPVLRSSRDPNVPWQLRMDCGPEPYVLTALRPGSKLDVALIDCFGSEMMRRHVELPSEPGTASVDLVLQADEHSQMTFRVVSDSGLPVQNARIMAYMPGVGGRSEDMRGGSMTYAPVEPGPYKVTVFGADHMNKVVEGTIVLGPQEVLVVLEGARELIVLFEDESGAALRPTSFWLQSSGQWPSGGETSQAGNQVSYSRAPMGPLTAHVRIGTTLYERTIDTEDVSHTLVFPSVGTLIVRIPETPKIEGDWGVMELSIRSLDDPSAAYVHEESFTKEGSGELRIKTELHPGRYQLTMILVDEVGATDEDAIRTTLEPQTVEVEAGKETSVTF